MSDAGEAGETGETGNPTQQHGLIARFIALSAANPFITLLLCAAMGAWGVYAVQRAPLDAIPDLSDVQVIIFTEWEGQSPDLVEDQITYPISAALLSAPKVKFVRGQSMFGMSFVYVIFDDDTDMYWARSRVLEYLSSARATLPPDVVPTLGPDATGVGWVFQYALVDKSGKHDLQQLRALQDWNVRYALSSVPGVAEIATVGGFVKQYQVQVDPTKMRARGVALDEVIRAVRRANGDVGGRTLEIAGHEHIVRGRGYVKSTTDLEDAVVRASPDGVGVRVRDVGFVTIGPDDRRGFAELDGHGEVVGGVVVMRYGENALNVIEAVKERLQSIERGLPEGVGVIITYDRSELIEASIKTLRTTLIEEMIIVSLVIFVFLLHVRSALVPILTLPLGVVMAFVPMLYQGLTVNIMSLGGIAVAIGAMVDASVILIENIHKKLEHWENEGRPGKQSDAVVAAMQEVGPSIFFSLLVITASFIPVFTLEGTEGRLFGPLAFTKTYSMGFAAILAVTATPALAALLIRGKAFREERNPINRALVALYTPVVRFVVQMRFAVVIAAVLIVAATVPVFMKLGTEFMPPLNEGAVLFMPTAPPGMGATEAQNALQAMDRDLMLIPEVVRVFGKMGRVESATDPAPIGMAETTVLLRPKEEWREGLTWEGLIAEMDEQVRYPGMPNIFWMPIQTRTEMLATGVRSPLGLQVFGASIQEIETASIDIERALVNVPGTRSAFAERSTGGFYIDIVVDRPNAARLGLNVTDINEVVMSAIGGMNIATTVEGRERYPINVRYPRELRDDPEKLANILVSTPMGQHVPLSQVAKIKFVNGPPMVRSEDGRLVGFVFVDTDRPIADYVEDARAVVARDVKLPPGTRVEWVGQFKYFERAKEKLFVVVPLTLLIVFVLLYLNMRSLVETGIVLLAVPFSLVGAIWLLFWLDYNISVAVWVGLIALAGLDAETGVVMLLYLTLAHRRASERGHLRSRAELTDAIVEGAAKRIRPKLMTVLTMMIGLIPILWSTGTGADVMKRIAAPMVGGLVTSFLLELTVYPALFAIWKGRALPRQAPLPPPSTLVSAEVTRVDARIGETAPTGEAEVQR